MRKLQRIIGFPYVFAWSTTNTEIWGLHTWSTPRKNLNHRSPGSIDLGKERFFSAMFLSLEKTRPRSSILFLPQTTETSPCFYFLPPGLYCNSLYTCSCQKSIQDLQYSLFRMLLLQYWPSLKIYVHITQVLTPLHRLPVCFTILLITFEARLALTPCYKSELLPPMTQMDSLLVKRRQGLNFGSTSCMTYT